MTAPVTDKYTTVSPATGKLHAEYDVFTDTQVEQAITEAEKGFEYLAGLTVTERAGLLNRFADAVEAKADELAEIITLEMGKPITQAKGEVGKCAGMARYHAEHTEEMLRTESISYGGNRYEFVHEPLGPVLFISTWNNPLLQATLAVVPQIAVGNSAVVKPSPNAPQNVFAIEKIFDEMNLPAKVYCPVLTTIPQTEDLLLNKRLKGVTFIGSTNAGKRVGSLAGQAFKPAVIDAGGSDPFIVLKDADIDGAAGCAVAGRFGNAGQSCVAAKRIIVEKDVYKEFLEKLIEKTKAQKVGDPFDADTDIGPVAKIEFRDKVKGQIDKAVEEGAQVALGGGIHGSEGAYLEPTILTGVTTDMVIAREEVFGPVAAVFKAENSEEAIKLANDTEFGLGASVWSENNYKEAVSRLETGNVAVNSKIATNFPVPFGGTKDSGYGVYFGREGLVTFTNTKVVSFTDG